MIKVVRFETCETHGNYLEPIFDYKLVVPQTNGEWIVFLIS